MQLLHGGRNVNRNLRIDTRVGRFVLRQRIREGPRPGADLLREVACHHAAAAAGVAPAVLDAAPDGRWILMDYVGLISELDAGRLLIPTRSTLKPVVEIGSRPRSNLQPRVMQAKLIPTA